MKKVMASKMRCKVISTLHHRGLPGWPNYLPPERYIAPRLRTRLKLHGPFDARITQNPFQFYQKPNSVPIFHGSVVVWKLWDSFLKCSQRKTPIRLSSDYLQTMRSCLWGFNLQAEYVTLYFMDKIFSVDVKWMRTTNNFIALLELANSFQ
jgi:hypothetical protein